MIYLTKEQIVKKITENRTPYWVLYEMYSNGRRATSPIDFFDPDAVTGDDETKLQLSSDKLAEVIDFYTANLPSGHTVYFYLIAKPNKKSSGETAKFEYALKVGTKQPGESPANNVNQTPPNGLNGLNDAMQMGFIPKDIVDEKMSVVDEKIRLAVREESIRLREQRLNEREKELEKLEEKYKKDSEKVKEALLNAGYDILDFFGNSKTKEGLAGTPHEKAVEDLASYIFENTNDEKQVKIVHQYIEKFLQKINNAKNGISEKNENNG